MSQERTPKKKERFRCSCGETKSSKFEDTCKDKCIKCANRKRLVDFITNKLDNIPKIPTPEIPVPEIPTIGEFKVDFTTPPVSPKKSISDIIREIAESAASPYRANWSPIHKEKICTPPDSPEKESKIDIRGFNSIYLTQLFSNKCIEDITKDIEDITPMLKKIIEKDNIDSNEKINIMFNEFILPYITEKIRYNHMLSKVKDRFREDNRDEN